MAISTEMNESPYTESKRFFAVLVSSVCFENKNAIIKGRNKFQNFQSAIFKIHFNEYWVFIANFKVFALSHS